MPKNLVNFAITDLANFTKEKEYPKDASTDWQLFYVGRDNVHEILKYVLSGVTTSLYLSMFGYDDDELNEIIMEKVLDPTITVVVTLDKSQAGGVHEKKLLDLDKEKNLAAFNTHFVVGQSATHQINHTKGFVADGRVGSEGSTNWSVSGEGTFTIKGGPGTSGFKAQNNTLSIFTNQDIIAKFQAQLINEHLAAKI